MRLPRRGDFIRAGRKTALILAGFFVAVGGLSEAAQPDGAFLTHWIVAGPLDYGAPIDSILGYVGGANATPREGDALIGCDGRWTPYQGEGNVINLRENTGYEMHVAAAAFCEFESDADQPGHIYCAAGNDIHVWLNGQRVLEQSKPNDEAQSPKVCDVSLKRGANSCLIVCRSNGRWLFGFTLRADGPEQTPAPPLIWNPLAPMVPDAMDGSYMLLSPDWKMRVGDDLAWAKPGYDDSAWERRPYTWQSDLPKGTRCWFRIHAHFAPCSTQVAYWPYFVNAGAAELYVDGVRALARGPFGDLLNPFHQREPLLHVTQECVIAIREIIDDPEFRWLQLGLQRGDKTLANGLEYFQPQRFHRGFLVFVFALLLVFYFFAYWDHPRRYEGVWFCAVLFLTCLAIIALDLDWWSDRISSRCSAWLSYGLTTIAVICGVAMSHAIGRGAVQWRVWSAYAVACVALCLYAYWTGTYWLAYLMFPLVTADFVRVWIQYEMIPRRANRYYIGVGIFLFMAGQAGAAAGGMLPTIIKGLCTYMQLWGLVGLMVCLMLYMAREAVRTMHDLENLTATLENRVVERTEQVQQLTQRLITAEEAERERLARELHDSVAQTLWFAKMAAENQVSASDSQPARDMVGFLDKAIGEVRSIAYGLRPPELDKLGFVQAISHLCNDFSYTTRISLDYSAHGVDNVALSPVAEVNLYRVLQEALNNIQQHAGASNVRVRLVGAFPNLILRVQDNGKGFDVARQRAEMNGNSMGLRSMEERIRLIGGTMVIHSAPGGGVRIVFEIPQQKEQA